MTYRFLAVIDINEKVYTTGFSKVYAVLKLRAGNVLVLSFVSKYCVTYIGIIS